MSERSMIPRGFPPARGSAARGGPPIPLKPRARATIPLSPGQRLKELLARSDARHLVHTTPIQDLFLLVKQVGLSDSLELLELTSPEQVQRMLDLDVWDRDELKPDTYGEWLMAAVEAKNDHLKPLIEGLDPEPLVFYLQEHVKVHLLDPEMTEQEKLELEALNGVNTPDGRFLLEFRVDDDHADFVRRLIEQVYAADLRTAYWLLEACRWELPSSLEEQAYRLRSGRLEELGFVGFYEAMVIYQPLKGTRKPPRESAPAPLAGPFRDLPLPLEHVRPADGTFLARAVDRLREEDPEDSLARDLLRLANKVIAADRLDPAEIETIGDSLRQVRAYLGLGLELESQGDLEKGVALLRAVHVEWLFRRGYTRALELQRRAKGLAARIRPVFRRLPGPHADSPYREVLEGLAQLRPQYYTGLENPTSTRLAAFQSVAQVERTAQALSRLEHIYRFVFEQLAPAPVEIGRLKRSLEAHQQAFTPGGVFLTALIQRLLGGPFAPDPLTAAQLAAAVKRTFAPASAPGELRSFAPAFTGQVNDAIEAFAQTASAVEAVDVRTFVDEMLAAFREAYGALDADQPLQIQFVGGPLFLEPA